MERIPVKRLIENYQWTEKLQVFSVVQLSKNIKSTGQKKSASVELIIKQQGANIRLLTDANAVVQNLGDYLFLHLIGTTRSSQQKGHQYL